MGLAWVLNKCVNRREQYIKPFWAFSISPPLAVANLFSNIPSLIKQILIAEILLSQQQESGSYGHQRKGLSFVIFSPGCVVRLILLLETWASRPKQSRHVASTAGVSPGTPWENGGNPAGFSIRMLACRLSWSRGTLGGWMWKGSRGVWQPAPGRGTYPLRCLCPTYLGRCIIPARRLAMSSTSGGSAWTWDRKSVV